jgi:hypothetical protein
MVVVYQGMVVVYRGMEVVYRGMEVVYRGMEVVSSAKDGEARFSACLASIRGFISLEPKHLWLESENLFVEPMRRCPATATRSRPRRPSHLT